MSVKERSGMSHSNVEENQGVTELCFILCLVTDTVSVTTLGESLTHVCLRVHSFPTIMHHKILLL